MLRPEDAGDLVATGGRGDKAIFVYEASKAGKLQKKLKLEGHSGQLTRPRLLEALDRPPDIDFAQ